MERRVAGVDGWLGSTGGKLYVTNQRLIWARDRLMPPPPRQSILLISIDDILDTEVHRWRVGVQTEERKYWFNFGWIFENRVKECRDIIAEAIRLR